MKALASTAIFCAALIVPTACQAEGAPNALRCVQTSHGACSEQGICIADPVISKFEITFDFRARRFKSAWGYGRITQAWDQQDGAHVIIVSAPPAWTEITFSPDYRRAGLKQGGSGAGYACRRSR